MALSIYSNYFKLSLLRVTDTRYAYRIIMTKRLRDVRKIQEKIVIDSDCKIYRDGSNEGKAHKVK